MSKDKSNVKSATDPLQIEKDEKADKKERAEQLDDLRAVLGTVKGRRLYYRLLKKCGAFRSVANNTKLNVELQYAIFYLSGQQDIGHFLQAESIEANEDFYLQMIKEASQKEK